MIYNNEEQKRRFEDELFNTALLGLLEIEGRELIEENEHLYAEAKQQVPSDAQIRQIRRMFQQHQRHLRMQNTLKYTAPVLARAAAYFLVFSVGTGTILFASADAWEVLYQLMSFRHDKYTQIYPPQEAETNPADYTPYISAGMSFAPTYLPDKMDLDDIEKTRYSLNASYSNSDDLSLYLLFRQIVPTSEAAVHLDTENAEMVRGILIDNSEGLLVVKEGSTQIMWSVKGSLLSVSTNLSTDEAILFAEGIQHLQD